MPWLAQVERYPPAMLRSSFAALCLLAAVVPAQNSTKKIRTAPSPLADRCGSAIEWLESYDAAIARAKETKRPVFWYVPTVANSPMDRQPEIDRAMRAGPFSWPSTIELLNSRFVPLRMAASGDLQKRHGLVRGSFVEPGWIALDADGKELARMHSITTQHPQWFEAPLRQLVGDGADAFPVTPGAKDLWDSYRSGDAAACERLVVAFLAKSPAPALEAEARFLLGAVHRRTQREADALAAWRECTERLPEQPFAWKCAMEAEGHGPFVRGIEDFLAIPARVLRDRDEGSRAPRGTYAEAELWQRGVSFVLAMADQDGIVRDSIYDFGGTDSLANVHIAVTYLCGEALLHAARRADAGQIELSNESRAAVEARLQQLLALAESDAKLALEDRDEILWAHAYRVRFLSRHAQLRGGASADKPKAILGPAVAALSRLQPETGMWFHEYGNPFAVATALQALAFAKEQGETIDEEIVARGVGALRRCRTEQGAYTYGDPGKRAPRATVAAAAGRMPLCELALVQWGKSDAAALQASLAAAFEHHALLAAVRKYDDHADRHGYGGFFFWFDMLGRAEATRFVEDAAQRDVWRAQQKKLVLDLPEFDGCFVDSHELGRAYGTAMALLCLAALADG